MRKTSLSSAVTYTLPAAEFASRAAALRTSLAGSTGGPAEADLVAIRTGVVATMPTANLDRYCLAVKLPGPGVGRLGHLALNAAEISAFVSISDLYRTVSVTLNLYLDEVSVDELIALSHSIYGRGLDAPLAATAPDTVSVQSLKELHDHLAEFLGITSPDQVTAHFRCVEIREIGWPATVESAMRRYSKALYGVVSADEGWRYVDEAAARSVLGRAWGTRSFARVVSMGDSCLVLNFRPASYTRQQRRFFDAFFGAELAYFSHQYRIAGLEHGAFFAMELCANRRCIADHLAVQVRLRSDAPSSRSSVLGGIRQRANRRSLYRELVQGLQRLHVNPPTELGALDNLVETASGLPERLRYLDQVVQAFEAEEQANYMYRVNSLMAMLACTGLVVAVLSTVIAVLVAQ